MLRTLKILWSGLCIAGCRCTTCRYFFPPARVSALRVIPLLLCRVEELYQSVKVSHLHPNTFVLCNLPACQGSGRAHTRSPAGRGQEMVTRDWKGTTNCIGAEGRESNSNANIGHNCKARPLPQAPKSKAE